MLDLNEIKSEILRAGCPGSHKGRNYLALLCHNPEGDRVVVYEETRGNVIVVFVDDKEYFILADNPGEGVIV